MRTPALILVTLLLCACSTIAAADTAFVIDRLLVGIHESKDTDSAILKFFPS